MKKKIRRQKVKEGEWKQSGVKCACVVFLSEWNMWKMGTSCVVYNHKHRLGEIWILNFTGKNEYRLLLHDTKGLES